ncbi:DUF192 domain-containing protein [Candidatus Roizmanbacteria bacterium]|nr:MAG: DUF192 domain-containing protein [Candidatus Roizmanbacteria bacterium]
MQIVIKIALAAAIVLLMVAVYRFYAQNFKAQKDGRALWDDYEVITKEVDGRELRLVVADTPERWQQGLMYVRKPADFDGMIFYFKTPQPQVFWNRNTFEDLDVYWMRKDKIIGKSMLPSVEKNGLKTVTSPGFIDTVIEVIR